MAGSPMKRERAQRSGSVGRSLWLAILLLAPVAAGLAADATVRTDSPQRYTVVEGDTLWDIASRFLEEPWLWPEVWQINPQIANPDLIYPGDIIELDYVDGVPVLRLARDDTPELRTVRLSPQVRREPLLSPIPAISLQQIRGHLSGNSVVSEAQYANAPYILAEGDGRTLASSGDQVHARGVWAAGVASYDIVRNGRTLRDPDTGTDLGIEAIRVGTATLRLGNGDEGILIVGDALQEIRVGDRLIPSLPSELQENYLPRPPASAIDAAIVSIGSGNDIGGTYDTLVLNAGRQDGLEVGHLLTIREPDTVIQDRLAQVGAWTKFKQMLGVDREDEAVYPGDNIGSVLIYRVFDNTSMGLVLTSRDALRLNDRIVTP